MIAQITPEDVTAEANRNYDLGRKHAKEELQPIVLALRRLYLSCAQLRLRIATSAPALKQFSDWDENTKAMQQSENAQGSTVPMECPDHVRSNPACPICARISQELTKGACAHEVVLYSEEADNFYCHGCKQGMGEEYYNLHKTWQNEPQ